MDPTLDLEQQQHKKNCEVGLQINVMTHTILRYGFRRGKIYGTNKVATNIIKEIATIQEIF